MDRSERQCMLNVPTEHNSTLVCDDFGSIFKRKYKLKRAPLSDCNSVNSGCIQQYLGHSKTYGSKSWRRIYLGCYVKCLVLKTKTSRFLQTFTVHSCDTTQFSRFFAVVMQFPVILRFFSLKILKFWRFYRFQNQANFEGFYNTPKKFS